MPIQVESRRKKEATLLRAHPGAVIVDVTSRGPEPWVRMSPFFPHGNIPIPGRPDEMASCVEGLWQGLKVFEHEDIDPGRWRITNMSGIKRPAGRRGRVLGHRFGTDGLLSYRDARVQIYLPAYRWVLLNRLQNEVSTLKRQMAEMTILLLDYETNGDIDDLSSPLSHAALVRHHLEGTWPTPSASSLTD